MLRNTQMLIFFGAICLISIIGGASSTDKKLSNNQKSQCTQPISYDISLEIQDDRLIVQSNAVLNVSCEQKYIRLQLGRNCYITEKLYYQFKSSYSYDLSNKGWDALDLYTLGNRFKNVDISLIENRKRYTDKRKRYERRVTLKSETYTISFKYNCILKHNVDTYKSQIKTIEFLYSPPIPNEWIFPYWENPATKARFTIQIKHKNTDKALSNMPIYQTIEYQIRKFQTVFFTTPLISTHLVTFIVIPNEYKTNTTSKSNVTITSSLEMKNDTNYARTLIVDITKLIRHIWDDIPRSNVSYMLLPITSTGYKNIVTPGFVFLSEVNSIYDNKVDSIIKEREVTCFIARNVLQEIFSDWLATFEQSDSWFLEGFLTVYGVYIWDEFLLKSIVVQTRRNILDYIEAFSKNDFPIQENPSIARNSTLRKIWREKGFSTFYMLNNYVRDILYDSMFKKAVHSYYITLLSSWQKWIYCQRIMLETYEDPDMIVTIFDLYRTQKKEKEFFELLPCFKQIKNLPGFLEYLDRIALLQNIVTNEKQSVLVSLLLNIFVSYSNNEVALTIILPRSYLERKLGIKRVSEMTILAIINCIINNIYSKNILLKITSEKFLNTYLHINSMEPFVLDVIQKKADSRCLYLDKMQNIIRFKPELIFTDQRKTKNLSFS